MYNHAVSKLSKSSTNSVVSNYMYMYFKSLFARSVQCYFFFVSRSNPDGYGVAPHCLDPGTVEHVTVENFDGQNWEQQIETSDIRSKSKE